MNMNATHSPHRPDGKADGFTTIELIVAFLLFGVVMSSAVGLLMSQRTLYDIQSDKISLQMNVRSAVDLVASELRTIPAGAVVVAEKDSIVVRYPFRWGMVCGYANKAAPSKDPADPPPPPAPDAELYMPVATDPLFAGHDQTGVAFRDTTGAWVFVDGGTEPWDTELYVESMIYCREGPGQKVEADKFDKEGNLIEGGDTVGPAYRRWTGYYTDTGQEAYRGAQVIAYSTVTYRWGPSLFEPGTRALFRITSAGEQELSGLFAEKSSFKYAIERENKPDKWKNEVRGTALVNVVDIRINAWASKDNQAGGADRALNYQATVDVVLRNAGEQQ